MVSLTALSAPAGRAVRLLWIVDVVGWVVFATAAAGGPGDPTSTGYGYLFVVLFVVPAALVLVRARLVARQRVTWALFGAGMLLSGAAKMYWLGALQDQQSVPYPSPADALCLAYYGLAFAAVLAMMRAGLSHVRRSVWIDATVGGLAIATIGAALLVPPILSSTGGSVGAVATNLAYPLMDVLILGLLVGVFAVTDGRPGRMWVLLGAVFAGQAVVDTVYL
ncbi:MAG: hypothetical protein QOJ35_2474, partial [Solirubrobacteraceae bacterium]|nr:hypothetical protein [Solirubrobacteraceae bacterium]